MRNATRRSTKLTFFGHGDLPAFYAEHSGATPKITHRGLRKGVQRNHALCGMLAFAQPDANFWNRCPFRCLARGRGEHSVCIFSLSYIKPNGLFESSRRFDMPMIDATLMTALAALLTSIAGLIWSLRHKG
jgi:hypothetical protein